jgi:signal transduction histidine kinase
MDHYADDLAQLIDALDLTDALLVGHSTDDGEVVRYIGRHGASRGSKAVLVGAVPPPMLKTEANPGGTTIEAFERLRAGVLTDRSQLYPDLSAPFYGANRSDSTVSQAVRDAFWLMSMQVGVKAAYDCIKQFSETDFTDTIHFKAQRSASQIPDSVVTLQGECHRVEAARADRAAALGAADLRDEMEQRVEQHEALRRLAMLIARGASPESLFAVVAEEVARVVRVPVVCLVSYEPDGGALVRASFGGHGEMLTVGTRYPDLDGATAELVRSFGTRSMVSSPIAVAGRRWGAMIVASAEREPLPTDTEEHLVDFTDLVTTAIANADSRRELAASRARIVRTADDARHRIERDLHDGVQQRLVSLALQLRTLQNAVPPGLDDFQRAMSRVADGLLEAQDELLELARGIHPAILARGGLAPALSMLARRCGIPVEIDVRVDGRLSERIEVAAYYVVSEALTNAAKHARASFVRVQVEADRRTLRMHVRDDGVGGADPTRGSGLIGLQDRVETFGGTIAVESPPGAGTSLHVALPLDDD